MQKAWTDYAWENYLHWQKQDKKTLKRINDQIIITQCGGHYRED